MKTMPDQVTSKSRLRLALVIGAAVALGAALWLLYSVEPPLWLSGTVIGIIVAGGVIVAQHARHTVYVCIACSHTFRISWLNDFLSPHLPDRKLLTCPKCSHTDWQTTIAYTFRNGNQTDNIA